MTFKLITEYICMTALRSSIVNSPEPFQVFNLLKPRSALCPMISGTGPCNCNNFNKGFVSKKSRWWAGAKIPNPANWTKCTNHFLRNQTKGPISAAAETSIRQSPRLLLGDSVMLRRANAALKSLELSGLSQSWGLVSFSCPLQRCTYTISPLV